MKYPTASIAYRQASIQQASTVGLVILLYDALAADLHRAIGAMQHGDIEQRCRHLKHGFLVLQQLDSLVDMERGGATARNLRRFYAHLRSQMLAAQFSQSPELLERQIAHLHEVRSAWQQVDAPAQAQTAPVDSRHQAVNSGERAAFSCSA